MKRSSLQRKLKPGVANEVMSRKEDCVRGHEGTCKGRTTIEHALYYAGKRMDEPWALVKLCAYHHGVDEFQDRGDLVKPINELMALQQATDEQLMEYPKAEFIKRRNLLRKQYPKLVNGN